MYPITADRKQKNNTTILQIEGQGKDNALISNRYWASILGVTLFPTISQN